MTLNHLGWLFDQDMIAPPINPGVGEWHHRSYNCSSQNPISCPWLLPLPHTSHPIRIQVLLDQPPINIWKLGQLLLSPDHNPRQSHQQQHLLSLFRLLLVTNIIFKSTNSILLCPYTQTYTTFQFNTLWWTTMDLQGVKFKLLTWLSRHKAPASPLLCFPCFLYSSPTDLPFWLCTSHILPSLQTSFYPMTSSINFTNSYLSLWSQIKCHSLQEAFPDPLMCFYSPQTSIHQHVTLFMHCLSFHHNVNIMRMESMSLPSSLALNGYQKYLLNK